MNERIRAREVRLIDQNGQQLGVVAIRLAQQKAKEAGLDLVEVSPNSAPPVAKILNYGKFKYEQQQKAKEAKKAQPKHELKEVRFRVNIEDHDYQTKTKQALKFLSQGHKVKAFVMFKGREQSHPELGQKILNQLTADTKEVAKPDQPPKKEGRNLIVVLSPLTK